MSLLLDDLATYLEESGLIDGYTIQKGEFYEGSDNKYIAILPDGGQAARPWIRNPRYRVVLFGRKSQGIYGQPGLVGEVASNIVEYVRDNARSTDHVFIETTEPQPLSRTESDRAVVQLVFTSKS